MAKERKASRQSSKPVQLCTLRTNFLRPSYSRRRNGVSAYREEGRVWEYGQHGFLEVRPHIRSRWKQSDLEVRKLLATAVPTVNLRCCLRCGCRTTTMRSSGRSWNRSSREGHRIANQWGSDSSFETAIVHQPTISWATGDEALPNVGSPDVSSASHDSSAGWRAGTHAAPFWVICQPAAVGLRIFAMVKSPPAQSRPKGGAGTCCRAMTRSILYITNVVTFHNALTNELPSHGIAKMRMREECLRMPAQFTIDGNDFKQASKQDYELHQAGKCCGLFRLKSIWMWMLIKHQRNTRCLEWKATSYTSQSSQDPVDGCCLDAVIIFFKLLTKGYMERSEGRKWMRKSNSPRDCDPFARP